MDIFLWFHFLQRFFNRDKYMTRQKSIDDTTYVAFYHTFDFIWFRLSELMKDRLVKKKPWLVAIIYHGSTDSFPLILYNVIPHVARSLQRLRTVAINNLEVVLGSRLSHQIEIIWINRLMPANPFFAMEEIQCSRSRLFYRGQSWCICHSEHNSNFALITWDVSGECCLFACQVYWEDMFIYRNAVAKSSPSITLCCDFHATFRRVEVNMYYR